MKIECWYCKELFSPGPRDFELVIAWINSGRKKGANAPFVKHRFGIWAHGDCARLPGQDAFNLEIPPIEDLI